MNIDGHNAGFVISAYVFTFAVLALLVAGSARGWKKAAAKLAEAEKKKPAMKKK